MAETVILALVVWTIWLCNRGKRKLDKRPAQPVWIAPAKPEPRFNIPVPRYRFADTCIAIAYLEALTKIGHHRGH